VLDSSVMILRKDWVRGILLIGLAAASVFLCTELFLVTAPSGPKIFSFSENNFSGRPDAQISAANEEIRVIPWSQQRILFNGTIAVTGSGARTDQVTLQEEINSVTVSFQPVFPDSRSSQGRSYLVNLNLYFPSTLNFSSFQIDTSSANVHVTGLISSTISIRSGTGNIDADNLHASQVNLQTSSGRIQVRNLEATNAYISSTGGNVHLGLGSVVPTGYYSASTGNGSVDLTVPAMSSFKLTATSKFMHAGFRSGFTDCQTHYSQDTVGMFTFESTFTASCGDGSATISLSSISGDAVVTRGS